MLKNVLTICCCLLLGGVAWAQESARKPVETITLVGTGEPGLYAIGSPPATLIILSSSHEFIVLQPTATGINWTAENGSEDTRSWVKDEDKFKSTMRGSVDPDDVIDLRNVFARVASMDSDKETKRRAYSLVLMDSEGVQTHVGLTVDQCNELRSSLRPVFLDVLKAVAYPAKTYNMLQLLLPEYKEGDARDIVPRSRIPQPIERYPQPKNLSKPQE